MYPSIHIMDDGRFLDFSPSQDQGVQCSTENFPPRRKFENLRQLFRFFPCRIRDSFLLKMSNTICLSYFSLPTYKDVFDPSGPPQSRPVGITIFTQVVCPSVGKSKLFKFKCKITAGRGRYYGLAMWIICDSCLKSCILFFPDEPEPPGRPFITGFTSRTISLSWTKPKDKKDSPVLGYAITTG